MIAILHTWTREMRYHPHVHILATAGGWDPHSSVWRKPRNGGFLVSGRALSVIFRGKVRDALEKTDLRSQAPADAWRRKWVVHCQHAGNGRKVLRYIGRYVHRIAITNTRIERFHDGAVPLRYRDRASGKLRRTTLDAQTFIARFLQHVLPKGFKKIRFYGLFSSRQRKILEAVRQLHEEHPALVQGKTRELRAAKTNRAPRDSPPAHLCPRCLTGTLILVASLPRLRSNGRVPRGPPP
ncbi:MAG TPA: hypothetical protein ENJ16_01455 [Planctomycetaceae bacterium]|nr:hypothetical protein [Planctomycetaceae bacterium]